MRVPPVERRRRRGRFRVRPWMIVVVVLIVVLFLSARGLAGVYTDYLWFDSVGFGSTWRGLVWARFAPAAVFTVGFFLMMLISLTLADRLAPRTRTLGPEDEMLARYQQSVGPYSGRIRVAVSAFFALIAGGSVAGEWQHWILFTHAKSFGIEDPQFHQDVGFYVFRLPFLTFVFGWLFAALIIVLVITAIAHYLNGGIRLQSPHQRVTPQVKAHLSVLLALMALVKTGQYYLARFELDFSTRGVVQGAGKTDVAAQLPALNLLMVISVVAAALFVWNIWRRGWVLPIIAVGLWAFVSLVIGTIFPAIYQKVAVDPNAQSKERPYITRNINATRDAFQLDDVDVRPFDYRENLTPQNIADNSVTIDNARLWDPNIILRSYQIEQGLQTFYKFGDADVDRYTVDNDLRQVMISARELNLEDLPSQSWVNRHIVYTHGFGAVVSPANTTTSGGLPEYLLKNIPPTGSIQLDRPELYFGERLQGFSLVDAKQDEFNYPRSGGQSDATTRYQGKGGVPLSSLVRRAAFALRYSDVNLLISGQISGKTRIIYERDVLDRVRKAAPFLKFDDDPYPVIANGRLVWMLDGYTTTNQYPYSQRFDGDGGLSGTLNYVRNSVKATVDAYDGTITMYVADPKDPVIRAWRSAFPKLFADYSKMPAAVKAHVRYPQDMFKAQTDVYRKYHVTNPDTFYQGNTFWDVSPDPGSGPISLTNTDSGATTNSTTAPQSASSTENRMEPLYVLMRLPGETREQFLLLRPFVPVSRGNALRNLRAFMVAKAEPGAPNRLQSFQTSAGSNVPGPLQVNSTINNTDEISAQFTLLGSTNSQVWQGSLQLLPIDDSLLYIRPIYVISNSGAQPNFRFVVMFYGQVAKFADSIDDALGEFGLAPPGTTPTTTPETPGTTTPPTTPPSTPETPNQATVDALLDQASAAYAAAQQALADGNLGEYQQQVTKIGQLLQQAAQARGAAGGGGSGSTSTTTSTTRARGGGDAQASGTRR